MFFTGLCPECRSASEDLTDDLSDTDELDIVGVGGSLNGLEVVEEQLGLGLCESSCDLLVQCLSGVDKGLCDCGITAEL